MNRFVIGLVMVLSGWQVSCRPAASNDVRLTQADMPFQKLHVLRKGDVVSYVLPSGRRLVWEVRGDSFFSAEQTTSSGLKTERREPAFEQLEHYGVCTSTNTCISIYSFDLDGYHIEVAEDLKATQNLPVVFRVSAGTTDQLVHEELRILFDKVVPTEPGPPLRVPIGTVHHEFIQKSDFPVRLVLVDNEIGFDVGGSVHALREEERLAKLTSLMDYVVQRYDGIDRVSRLSMNVLKGDAIAWRYEAEKDAHGHWALRKQ